MRVDFYTIANSGSYEPIYQSISQDDLYTNLSNLTIMGIKRRNRVRPNQNFTKFDNNRLAYAFSVVDTRDSTPPPGVKPWIADVTAAKRWLTDQKTEQIYYYGRDVTDTLPAPNRGAARLSVQDFDTAATELGIASAAIHAVAEVEAGGRDGFNFMGRPKILFEGYLFRKYTGKKFDLKYPWLSKKYSDSREFYGWDQWSRIYEAMDLDAEAAFKSASWGLFQVMGFNHNGWGSVMAFVTDMFVSEYKHLKAFTSFCVDKRLKKYINNRDWTTFASKYNGEDCAKNHYDTKMAAAYAKYAKWPDSGRVHLSLSTIDRGGLLHTPLRNLNHGQ